MDFSRLVSERARAINGSGIRQVFERGARLKEPINLSIGQPDFPVPEVVKRAAVRAIEGDRNGYALTRGIGALRERLARHIAEDVGWRVEGAGAEAGLLVTSGTSGGIALAMLALMGPGDEAIIPDPYFVAYPHLATLCGGRAVCCDTYPDFRMTAARVEPLITSRTKLVLVNSPSNPAGVVLTRAEMADLLDLCRRRGIVLVSDEIYDIFTYGEARTDRTPGGAPCCPSPARLEGASECVLLVRGFGKTYGVTGWRLGYVAGPPALVEEMTKLQQYTYVCAPTPLQEGAAASLDVDMSGAVAAYERRRNMVIERLRSVTEVATPGGAFYVFPRVPEGQTGSAFLERCVERSVLVVPGKAFSTRDTHVRVSYATDERTLERGLDVLVALMANRK